MAPTEHTLSFLLRNSGAVLAEAQQRDVVLHRRDGEDLLLSPLARERGVRDSLGIAARVLKAVLAEGDTRSAVAVRVVDELPWTHFLPSDDRERFLDEFATTAAACVETETFEPLARLLRDWRATAEIYATPEMRTVMDSRHEGVAIPLRRPQPRRSA